MGLPLPGWEVAILDPDEQPVPPGERGRDLPQGPLQPPLPARLLEPARGLRGGLRRRLVPHQGHRPAGRGRLRLVLRPGRRRDHLGRLPDRAVRGREHPAGAPGGGRVGGGGQPRPAARPRRQGVRRAGAGHEPATSWPASSSGTSASACRPTPTRASSSSWTTCPRPSPARSAARSCASRSASASRPRRAAEAWRSRTRDRCGVSRPIGHHRPMTRGRSRAFQRARAT